MRYYKNSPYAVVGEQRNRNVPVRYRFFSLGLYSSLGFYTRFWTKSLGGRLIVKSAYTRKYTVETQFHHWFIQPSDLLPACLVARQTLLVDLHVCCCKSICRCH